MRIRNFRIRLSKAWYKITFATASLLLSFSAHASKSDDSTKVKAPNPSPIILRNDTTVQLGDTLIDKALKGKTEIPAVDDNLKGRMAMYGSPDLFFIQRNEPLPGSTTIDETIQGTSGNAYYNTRR
ncbi:MAG: hypothetical protein MJY66_05865 [Bacteroidaceae bacterium]|nr:hypothetical protein [Bacteroidaceae bacterium]